jgi:hypothetical protein
LEIGVYKREPAAIILEENQTQNHWFRFRFRFIYYSILHNDTKYIQISGSETSSFCTDKKRKTIKKYTDFHSKW